MKRIILSSLVMAALLFVWSGLSQMLPWGVSSTQNVSIQGIESQDDIAVSNMLSVAPNSLTTEAFDAQFMDKISTYSTERSFSWIITQPIPKSYTGYFMKEALGQLLVALLLSMVLFIGQSLPFKRRILLVILTALAASAATYGQFLNWWQMPSLYALGASFNLILGWTLSAVVGSKFIPSTHAKGH